MADLTIARGATSGTLTTTNANTALAAATDRALLFMANVSAEPVRVFFSPNNDLTLETSLEVGFSGTADEVELARGILIEAGEAVRVIVSVDTPDADAADNTITITARTVHTAALEQINLFVASQADFAGATL